MRLALTLLTILGIAAIPSLAGEIFLSLSLPQQTPISEDNFEIQLAGDQTSAIDTGEFINSFGNGGAPTVSFASGVTTVKFTGDAITPAGACRRCRT